MAALDEYAMTRVATATGVDMQAVAKNDIYTVPVGKVFIPTMVVVRNPSLSLAGGTDYDLGSGAACDTWRQAVNLASMIVADTDYMVIRAPDVTKYTEEAAGNVFGIKPITGSTAAATATIDLFGFLFDA